MLNPRKQAVLQAVVEQYIRMGEPIGSKAVVEHLENAVSSATIRNEMAELSALGYLSQPHTSAGRVPTGAGFRLYIDTLMPHRDIDGESKREWETVLGRYAGDPERLMDTAAQLLADRTGYAAVAAAPKQQNVCVRRLEILPMGARSAVLIMVTSSGVLRNRVCRFDRDVTEQGLRRMLALLNEQYGDRPVGAIRPSELQRLLLAFGDDGLYYAPLLTALHDLAQSAEQTDVFCGGELNLLQLPDYAPQTARSLLGLLAQRDQLARLMHACGGLRVMLGAESTYPELAGTSMIVTPYAVDGAHGAIALVGPVRMDYAVTIPQMEYAARLVGRLLAETME